MDQGYATTTTRAPEPAEASTVSPGVAARRSSGGGSGGVGAADVGGTAAAANSAADAQHPAPPEAPRPLRRDAERNRLLILSAAKVVFAQRGLDASLDEVAKEAGLGVGTVYRRFPNRDALIDALFFDVLTSIERIVDESLAAPRAWDGLIHFMTAMLESQAQDKGLRDVMISRHVNDCAKEDVIRDRVHPALYDLVRRAQEEGDLRADLVATDIGVLEVAALGIVEFTASAAPDVWSRYLSIIIDGLRTRPNGGNAPLHHPPLDDEQIDACMAVWKYGSRETPRPR